jgi:hypothetical protein
MVSPRWEAHQIGAARCVGIDLKRSQYINDFGNYNASSAASFRAGMLVSLNSSQEFIVCPGANPFGFAKYDKTTGRYAAVVGERIQLNGTTATNLAHANLFTGAGGGVRVADAEMTGSPYTLTTDYTVNSTNGTITRAALSGITDGAYVYVNYMYALTSADEASEGYNFWLSTDDATMQDLRMTVIQPPGIIFTSQYDMTQTYAVNDAIYSGASGDALSGYVTKRTTSTVTIGKVFQIPTATDPWLGVDYKS